MRSDRSSKVPFEDEEEASSVESDERREKEGEDESFAEDPGTPLITPSSSFVVQIRLPL